VRSVWHTSFADEMIPRLSRSHWTARPAMATPPSSAYRVGASWKGWVGVREKGSTLAGRGRARFGSGGGREGEDTGER
jgi:hypothetical protein